MLECGVVWYIRLMIGTRKVFYFLKSPYFNLYCINGIALMVFNNKMFYVISLDID
jgi:hypothetical protein